LISGGHCPKNSAVGKKKGLESLDGGAYGGFAVQAGTPMTANRDDNHEKARPRLSTEAGFLFSLYLPVGYL
jgi:hypothetical protein